MEEKAKEKKPATFPARVVEVVDEYTLVINRGADHGIRMNQRLLVYALSQNDVIDPDTGENLGKYEIVKGTGVIRHIQPRMSTLNSDMKMPGKRRIVKRQGGLIILGSGGGTEEVIEPSDEMKSFDDAERGDYVKPI